MKEWLAVGIAGDEEEEGRFRAWSMSASHLIAGTLSSFTSTLPALRGTISWNPRT